MLHALDPDQALQAFLARPPEHPVLDKAAAERLEVSPRDAFAPVFIPLRKAQPKIGQRDPPSLPG
ncbi:hypothetical protein D3C83_149580 [compost metagenome]